MNLRKVKRVHFTGIKGVGMTALALCFQDLGKQVRGSDLAEKFPTDAILKQRQLKIKIGFSPRHLASDCQLLIYTGAHNGARNIEVVEAKKRGIPAFPHSQALAWLGQAKTTLAVAGVGGKSTTSAMLAAILAKAGFEPSFAIGVGNIPCLGAPGRALPRSRFFVVEADEYVTDPQENLTPRFHYLKPEVAVITNLEYDHPDVYPDLDSIFASFQAFVKPVPSSGLVILNYDNRNLRLFSQHLHQPWLSYGFSPQADWRIVKTHVTEAKQIVSLQAKGVSWPELVLQVPGEYNCLNAVAAASASYHFGVKPEAIRQGLARFTGTKRRFELIKTVNGISLYDDYAHHPSEIKAILKAARAWLPGRRLIAVFQAHTYSRTQALLADFAQCFSLADVVLINDIFPSARETDNLGLTGKILAAEVKKAHPRASYCPDKAATLEWLAKNILPGDVIFTLGAGNNWLWHKDIIKLLQQR